MKDAEYVKAVLQGEYATERANEIPYPDLNDVIASTDFNYEEGTVLGELPNGSKSREGHDYLWFKFGEKSILSHRFIVAVTLGKWPPRDFEVDHDNHNPSDNRPSNLRVVTPKDNAGHRRKALLSQLVDIGAVSDEIAERRQKEETDFESSETPLQEEYVSHDTAAGRSVIKEYTGETRPGKHSGTFYRTSFGSWHWYADGDRPNQTFD